MEYSAPEGARMFSLLRGSGDNIDSPLCSGLYKEEEDSLVPCSGTYPDAKMN